MENTSTISIKLLEILIIASGYSFKPSKTLKRNFGFMLVVTYIEGKNDRLIKV